MIEYVAAPLEVEGGANAETALAEFEERRRAIRRAGRRRRGDVRAPLGRRGRSFGREAEEEHGEEVVDVKDEDGAVEAGSDEDEDDGESAGLSNKQRKLASRMKVAELKRHCCKPEVVEVWDVTAADPGLLVFLKAYRNTIPVPSHWCQKRKYLQGKRGSKLLETPELHRGDGDPEASRRVRGQGGREEAEAEAKDAKTAKMGKIDIDYRVLHDAFFKHQTKPKPDEAGRPVLGGQGVRDGPEGEEARDGSRRRRGGARR